MDLCKKYMGTLYIHCVEPVPRSFAVPMARTEPVQTAWAMSKAPSMAMEAREIVDDLMLAGGYQTRLTGSSAGWRECFVPSECRRQARLYSFWLCPIGRVHAEKAWSRWSTFSLLPSGLIQSPFLFQRVISYNTVVCPGRRLLCSSRRGSYIDVQFKPQH